MLTRDIAMALATIVLAAAAIAAAALLGCNRAPAAEPAPFRLCDDAKHARLVALIPRTDDPWMEAVRADPRLVVYTDAEMPKASQFWDSNPLAGVHDAKHNISANPLRLPDGSLSGGPGQEFPWRVPFGLDGAQGWTKFTFVRLPERQPVRWWRERLPGDGPRHASYRWEFPVGTVFGEVLCVQDAEGWSYPFELRVRHKVGAGTWRPDVFRPVRDRAELERLAPEVAGQGARAEWQLANPHPAKVIREHAVEDVLPPLPAAKVRELLARTFTSVRETEWVPGGHAPGTRADFHIVPKNYAGAAIAVTAHSCARCHQTTLGHPDDFGPVGFGRNGRALRDWYGRVPGDDQAFTWHPFDPASVSPGGYPQPVRLNPRMVAAGLLEQWK